jgi:hypothetical protein
VRRSAHRPIEQRRPDRSTRSITSGLRRLLDIGTGLPTADNTHQVAQRIAPEARIVYVDNDPDARNQATQMSIDAGIPYIARHPYQTAAYVHGLDLIDPDVVSCTRWRPDPADGEPAEVDAFCGAARIP